MKILIYGSVNIDSTFSVKDIVRPGETISCSFSGKAPGGKGANQAFAAGRASDGRFPVFFAGKADEEASFIFEKMKTAGIDCSKVVMSGYGTGTAIIQVAQNGENSILVCGNGNTHIEKEEIDSVLEDFSEGDCIILNAEINNLDYLIDRSAEKGLAIFFNPSPVNEKLKELPLNKATYLVFNEAEGSFFAEKKCNGPQEILEALAEKYPSCRIVLTLGDKGSCVMADGLQTFSEAFKVSAVDTTGCGDTFLGYFAVEVMSGSSIAKALSIASEAASIAATRHGAMNSIPARSEICTHKKTAAQTQQF